jgi:hypothetical protein
MSNDPRKMATDASSSSETLRALVQDQSLALLLAQNPSAPSDVLEKLSQSKEPEVLQALAKNPNTPQATLFAVGQKYIKEFLENPIVPLWFLEQPDLVKKMPQVLLLRLLDFPLPESWLAQMAQYAPRHILSRIAGLPSISSEILSFLAKQNLEEVDVKIAKNPNTTPEVLAWLLASESKKVRTVTLQNPKTPKDFYQLLAKACGDADLSEIKANSAALTQEELLRLSRHNLFAKKIAASRFDTPPNALLLLSQEQNESLCLRLATHPKLPLEAFQAFSTSMYSEVRARLFQNPSVPAEVVMLLASDSAFEVELAYINSPHIPQNKLLARIASVSHVNPTEISPKTIERLFQDITDEGEWLRLVEESPFVTRLLLYHQKSPVSLWLKHAKSLDEYAMRDDFLQGRHPPEEVLWVLAENPACQQAVARYEKTPAKLLDQLSSSSFLAVKNAVAVHPNTPALTLEKLSKDDATSVRKAIANNLNTPIHILEAFSKRPDTQVKRAALKTLNKKNLLLILA